MRIASPGHARILFVVVVIFVFHQLRTSTCDASEITSAVDSASIVTFLNLHPDTLKTRQQHGEQLARAAGKTDNGLQRRALLKSATRAAPSATRYWLALAGTELAMGYANEAEKALGAARVTIDFIEGSARREIVREYSLAKGWSAFHAGRWHESRDWGKRALKYGAGLDGHLIVSLNSAQIFNTFSDLKVACRVFDPIHSGGNRQANKSWCYLLYFYFHKFPFDEMDVSYWQDRSIHHAEQDAMRWRDFGLYCEGNNAGLSAITYYEKAAQSVAARLGGWLTRLDGEIPKVSSPMPPLPFWVNPDGGYVTGSLLAYLGHAHNQMLATKHTAAQNIWAKRILAAYGRTIRRCPDAPWSILWRSEALMVLDRMDEASTEIRYARASFQQRQYQDPNLDRVHGHLLLRQKNYGKAEPMIRAAVSAFPEDATCWTDLGLIEVFMGHPGAAHEAFDMALGLDEKLAVAWFNRGLLNLKEGHLQPALADLEQAAWLAPENEHIISELTRLHQVIEVDKKQN